MILLYLNEIIPQIQIYIILIDWLFKQVLLNNDAKWKLCEYFDFDLYQYE